MSDPIFPTVPAFAYPTDKLPVFTAENFLNAFMHLLPRGRAWATYPESNLMAALAPLMPTYERSSQSATNLLVDIFPARTLELLPEWEASLGLPDPCAGESTSTDQRRNQVIARFINNGGQSMDYIIAFALQLGFEITITENVAGFRLDYSTPDLDVIADEGSIFYWYVHSPLFTESLFHTDINVGGDPLGAFSNNDVLECELNSIKPAHTELIFVYTS